ncbi:MAG TPA: hypothetical protein VFC44_16260 [Candidatus Saccharimonadales bacterium]|nr:hypothetical protein [Candidatus Saccharimonadales bacterium]
MKTNPKPASLKARILLKKLQALAERGIGGEKIAAQKKLARLKASLDFTASDPTEASDLFAGRFACATKATRIWSFGAHELDVANSVKWAIESATRIPCLYRHGDLLANASPATARRLKEIAVYIAGSFGKLLDEFRAVDGVNASDRNVFVMGLYDGMMNEVRDVGQRLPGRANAAKTRKAKKSAVTHAAGLHVHPYTIGLSLGKQIRFSTPVEQIAAELEALTQKHLPAEK